MKNSNALALVKIISALLIVNYHTSVLSIPGLNHIAKFGFIFNTVFVFLSGYLLSSSFSLVSSTTANFSSFIYNRITRVYPSLHAALVIITLIYLFTGHEFTITSLMLAATGFSYYLNDNTFGLHLWFVSVILICYLLFIPTRHVLQRHPKSFLILLLITIVLTVFLREGTFNGIYNKVSSDITYRFIYHYMVFSLAIYLNIQRYGFNRTGKKWISLFIAVFFLYIYFQPKQNVGHIAIVFSVILAISTIQIILAISPFVERYFPQIFLLSSVTYEIYLVHYSVIDALSNICHGKYIGYPLVYFFSIAFAFVIRTFSKPYERLLKHCIGWLLERTPLIKTKG